MVDIFGTAFSVGPDVAEHALGDFGERGAVTFQQDIFVIENTQDSEPMRLNKDQAETLLGKLQEFVYAKEPIPKELVEVVDADEIYPYIDIGTKKE